MWAVAAPALAGRYKQRFNYPAGTLDLGDGSTPIENFSGSGTRAADVRDDAQHELQLTAAGVNGTR